ncbi:MAG: PilZ domain-containing protein [Gammaproteobacteria bacterium]
MLGIFRKKTLRSSFFPRDERTAILGDVYVKRNGFSTLKANQGNMSEGGLYVLIPGHDLERGKKVEIVLVSKNGSLRRISRMMGIVIRTDEQGAAMVTYKKENMNSQQRLLTEEQSLKQEFGDV